MKNIPLYLKGEVVAYASIDDSDFEFVSRQKWFLQEDARGKRYARRQKNNNGHVTIFYLHRELLRPDSGQLTDHIDGNGLNNRRENLRNCTMAQNTFNRDVQSNNKLGLKGVSWCRAMSKYIAVISRNRVRHVVGYFDDPLEAHMAYKAAASGLHGAFAHA